MTDAPVPPLDHELAAHLFSRRIVVLGDELDQQGGNRLCAQLLTLAADDAHRDIRFWINSPGGSVPAMLAIHDVMRTIPNDVVTVAMGMAASAGQFLLTAGTPGRRFALPHAKVLLHQGSSGIGGTAVDIELQADDLRQTRDTLHELTARYTGQTVERIALDSLRDRWFTAEAAREYGFIDHVVADVDQVTGGPARVMTGLRVPA